MRERQAPASPATQRWTRASSSGFPATGRVYSPPMHEIPLLGSRIFAGPGLLDGAGARVKELAPRAWRACGRTDAHGRRYAKRVAAGREAAGRPTSTTAVPSGEARKGLARAAKSYAALVKA